MDNKFYLGCHYIGHQGVVFRVIIDCDDNGKVFYDIRFIGNLIDKRGPVSQGNVDVVEKAAQTYLVVNRPMMTLSGRQRIIPRAVALEIIKFLRCRINHYAAFPQEKQKQFVRMMANSSAVIKTLNGIMM